MAGGKVRPPGMISDPLCPFMPGGCGVQYLSRAISHGGCSSLSSAGQIPANLRVSLKEERKDCQTTLLLKMPGHNEFQAFDWKYCCACYGVYVELVYVRRPFALLRLLSVT
jgi:hypothetical protein